MQLKDYQQNALKEVRRYLELAAEWRKKAILVPDAEIDFAEKAWEKLGKPTFYRKKRNGLGENVPNFVLKIPTGGGKTLLAVKVINLINDVYRERKTGMVLWVVPTTEIYRQTIKALKDRNHPYRQHLDMASGGRTIIREKFQGKIDRFSPLDVEENLVVYVMMLQAANRETKDDLRLFKDSGGFQDFFPPEDRADKHEALLKAYPNLDTFGEKGSVFRQVKTSLGNTLRILKPVIILDESQKAYSVMAQNTLMGFNPSVVVELSATPVSESNILVDIRGMDLKKEEMIKLDLHVFNKVNQDWKLTLHESVVHRDKLEKAARLYEAKTGVYIRPICLIQVERVGKEQRHIGWIHAEDAKDELIQLGISEDQIAIKTSEKDELKDVDDVGGLMSKDCTIRYIITKQALQEGWDCSFAYILTILNNPKSQNGLTQLVGRILRQPNARKTRESLLDESYVFTYSQIATELLDSIRKGFEHEGLGDLKSHLHTEDGFSRVDAVTEKTIKVRKEFQKYAKQVILPVFAIKTNNEWQPVNYTRDIDSRISWNEIKINPPTLRLTDQSDVEYEYVTNLSDDVKRVVEDFKKIRHDTKQDIDIPFATRYVSSVVSNPWVSHALVEKIISDLIKKHGSDRVGLNFIYIVEEIRKELENIRDTHAAKIFEHSIKNGDIRFLVIEEKRNRIGYSFQDKQLMPSDMALLRDQHGSPVQKSLFDEVAAESFNDLEKNVVYYLEDQDRLFFWYRNEPREDYGLQGWRHDRVYPDFIFTVKDNKCDGFDKVFIVETKGDQLAGNEDTIYKKSLFELCNNLAKEQRLNELALSMKDKKIEFEMIEQKEWEGKLNEIFS